MALLPLLTPRLPRPSRRLLGGFSAASRRLLGCFSPAASPFLGPSPFYPCPFFLFSLALLLPTFSPCLALHCIALPCIALPCLGASGQLLLLLPLVAALVVPEGEMALLQDKHQNQNPFLSESRLLARGLGLRLLPSPDPLAQDSMVQWFNGSMVQWFNGSMTPDS